MSIKRTLCGFASLLFVSLCLMTGLTVRTSIPDDTEHATEAYGRLPMSFVANQGQTDSAVKFISRGSGYHLYLTSTEAVFTLRKPASQNKGSESAAVLRMRLAGANPAAHAAGRAELPGKVNYFIGDDPAKWRTSVPTYARVQYTEVYPGVDLVYYGNPQQLEYDFVVAPGADPNVIRLDLEGVRTMRVDARGDLVLRVEDADVRWQKPIIYQERDGVRREVAGNYVVNAPRQVGFEVGAYDPSLPLVIDPVLVYSTYLGGSGFDSGSAIAVDVAGNAYVSGSTASTDFPTTAGAFDGSNNGTTDAFVTKLNPTGTALVYSTYLGGSGSEAGSFGSGGGMRSEGAKAIAVDAFGNAYVTGTTRSADFPTTPGAFDVTFNDGVSDAFVTKLDATGAALVYSTFLGGTYGGIENLFGDTGNGIALDALGNAYVTGATSSHDFPTTVGAVDTVHSPTAFPDAFVTKLNSAGSALLYSTYLGFAETYGNGIAVDAVDSAYVTGFTSSSAFPTTFGAYDTSYNGGPSDAFVVKLNTTAFAPLVYSTFFGGSGSGAGLSDRGLGIAVDATGSAYVTGFTLSNDFPTTPGVFDTTFNGTFEAFVTKLNPAGSGLVYSTYLGGPCSDSGNAIAVDGAGRAYVTGSTGHVNCGANFPTTLGAFDTTYNGGTSDAFVAQLDASGSALAYSTHLGGNGNDSGAGIAVDTSGSIYVTGSTTSANFPTTLGAVDIVSNGGTDAFVTKIVGVDTDEDGVPDAMDAFPLDPAESVDTDGDGIGNNADTDDDNDGTPDATDALPLDATESVDTDGDGTGDNADTDDDNDSTPDATDAFPTNPAESSDTDGDGIGNNADAFPADAGETIDTDFDGIGNNADADDDNDGLADTTDAFPLDGAEWVDTDGDGIGNNTDTDDDGDGVPDVDDALPLNAAESVDTDGDGTGNNADLDDDGDGVADATDAFPLDAAESVDTDGDGAGNNADTDDDNDGTADASDAFPLNAAESVDTDSDGTGNNADADDDGDGVADASDAFPLNAAESVDTDSDGTGNNADADDDGDGVADATDAFPLDATETVDTDRDGTGNNVDADDDGDGVADAADAFPLNADESVDTDSDGTGNNADADDDGDGVADASDAFPLNAAESVDTDGDGTGNNADADDDGDGTPDATDAFPLDAAESVDTDGDGTGNNADADDDGDGVADADDAFPLNADESVDTDSDGTGNNADADDDGDGVSDGEDAFPLNAAESVDTDGDGTGNNADADDDGDGTPDATDAFPLDAAESVDTDGDGTGNNADADDDGDGVADAGDAFPLNADESVDTDSDGIGNNADTDDDGDGVADGTDAFPLNAAESVDTDGDGTGNNADADDDGDGTPDATDAFPLNAAESVDTDSDGTGNNADADDDGDGVADASDAFPLNAAETKDTDSDGTGNNADADDDGDGTPDATDAFPLNAAESVDTDGDGTGNNADTDDDNDGLADVIDPFPANPDANGDGIPDGNQPGRMRGNGSVAGGAKRDDFSFDVDEGVRRRGRRDGDTLRLSYEREDQKKKGRTNRFESTAVSSIVFIDDPAFRPNGWLWLWRVRSGPRIDTVIFAGEGKFNGKSGYTFEATATDQGEPGARRDTFSLVVKDAHGVVVFSESGELSRGNIESLRLQPERDDRGRDGWGR